MSFFLGTFAAVFFVNWIVFLLKSRRLEREAAEQDGEIERLKYEVAHVRKHYETECNRILSEAQASIAMAQKFVNERLAEAGEETGEIRANYEEELMRLKTDFSHQADIAREQYQAESNRILSEARATVALSENRNRQQNSEAAREIERVKAAYEAETAHKIDGIRTQYEEESRRLNAQAQEAIRRGEELVQQAIAGQQAESVRVREHYAAEAIRLHTESQATIDSLREQLASLQQLGGIAQSEEEARKALSDAIVESEALRAEAKAFLEKATNVAAVERSTAAQKAKEIRHHADALLSQAKRDAGGIIAKAHTDAEGIAGDAYKALREQERLERALIAIQNVVDGYGDRYIIPTRSILDDLAADFGHTEAGQALAGARAHSRRMVTEGEAAECDYVEAVRRETALKFVIDAFNGRVDAILSRTKHDNYGTLEQEIRDAFALVNLNGKAFRDARILPTYLESRVSELRWGVVAQELRLKEREEQRRLKEMMREEEKARREYEKAIQDAQREEAILLKALERARQEAAVATNEQKQKFEVQIAMLNQKLTEAEARNQRAKSMAQQTRKGNVYIISNVGSFGEDVFKIGMTRRLEPFDRIKELGDASVPFEFDVHAMIPCEDAPALEKILHEEFDEQRINHVNYRKEFFRVPLSRVREIIAARGIEASFTMVADAKEFRESARMNKMSPAEREKYWVHLDRMNEGVAADRFLVSSTEEVSRTGI